MEEAPPELKRGDAGDLRPTRRFFLLSCPCKLSYTVRARLLPKAFDAMQGFPKRASEVLADEQLPGNKVGKPRAGWGGAKG